MAFDDDDEEEVLPECVTDYMFVDESEEPVCFSILPFQCDDSNSPQACKKQVFLRGDGDDGLQKIYKQVVAWKVELQGFCPVVYVLSKENKWIKLLKPKKSFEVVIRKVLITLQCLQFIRKDPEASEQMLWGSVRKIFSNYEIKPSRLDLRDHTALVREIAQKDEQLGKSQLLLDLLDSRKKVTRNEDLEFDKMSEFINDGEDDEEAGENNKNSDSEEDDEEDDGYDAVCCICDNGGKILCCDGRCMRSFHAVKGDGRDSDCATLGLSRKEVEESQIFKCPNCRFEQHQCFVCRKLGSSAESSREVFPCVNATCGHFYHPRCVAKLLHPDNKAAVMEEEKKIAAGHPFACPYHKCLVCRGIENKEVHELQFAMCRRCPRSYHRKCLPREISEDSDEEEDIVQRAWDGLLANRILIYCLDHEIDEDLGTPVRDHLAFPEDPEKKKMLSSRKVPLVRQKGTTGSKEKDFKVPSEKGLVSSDWGKIVKTSGVPKKQAVSSNGVGSTTKGETSKLATSKVKGSIDSGKQLRKAVNDITVGRAVESSKLSTLPRQIDPDTVKRIETLVHRSSSSLLTLDDFIDKKEKISTHIFSGKHVDKTITLGKVKGSIEAVQTALKQVEEDDGKTENAKAVCEPKVLHQIMTWKNKLSVYLGPFVHGLLYTSFGRHFTKVEKLEEIVDRLHWYIQSGDMIVDFCCGSNDFSIIMKKKLEDTGKNCDFRNFDIIPPKNDFNFLKRDWMKVRHKDLNNVPGSNLIMGLNPPFGLKAALANKFIDKALEFRPKLLILIVPKETQRLDEKKNTNFSYDLIWEDDKKLSGKAFYLPGSVDDNDKQVEDWNLDPPPLYLWSRSDFTEKHRDIAREHGHLVADMNNSGVGKGTIVGRQPPGKDEGFLRKDRNDLEVVSKEEASRSPRDDMNNSGVGKGTGVARQPPGKDDGSVRKDRNDREVVVSKEASRSPRDDMNSSGVGKGTGVARQPTGKDYSSVRKDGNDCEVIRKEPSPALRDGNDVVPKPDHWVPDRPNNNNTNMKRKAERQDGSSVKPESGYASNVKKMKKSGDASSKAREEELSDMSISPSRSPQKHNLNETHQTLLKYDTIPVVSRRSPDYNTMTKDEAIPVVSGRIPDYGMTSGRLENPDPLKSSTEKSPYLTSGDIPLSTGSTIRNTNFGDPARARSTELPRYGGLDVYRQEPRPRSPSSLYVPPYSDYLHGQGSLGPGRQEPQSHVRTYSAQQDHLDFLASKYQQKDPLDSLASKYQQTDPLDSLTSKYQQKDPLDLLASKYQPDHLDSLTSKYSLGGASGLGQSSGLGQTRSHSIIDKYTVGLNTGYTQRSTGERPSVNSTTPGSYGQVHDVRGYSRGPRHPLDGNNSAGWLND